MNTSKRPIVIGVQRDTWLVKQFPLGLHKCESSICIARVSDSRSDEDAYVGVYDSSKMPKFSQSGNNRKNVLVMLENPNSIGDKLKFKKSMSLIDMAVGYRNYLTASQISSGKKFLKMSYISDPMSSFKIRPNQFQDKKIEIFSMIKNCNSRKRNSLLHHLDNELHKHGIKMHHFGRCVPKGRERSSVSDVLPVCKNTKYIDPNRNVEKECILYHSKFYVAFENSRDAGYSTEKLWQGLKMGSVPIVWGDPKFSSYLPSPEAAVSVDRFSGIDSLASHIYETINNHRIYEGYLSWKKMNVTSYQDNFKKAVNNSISKLFCRVCDALSQP